MYLISLGIRLEDVPSHCNVVVGTVWVSVLRAGHAITCFWLTRLNIVWFCCKYSVVSCLQMLRHHLRQWSLAHHKSHIWSLVKKYLDLLQQSWLETVPASCWKYSVVSCWQMLKHHPAQWSLTHCICGVLRSLQKYLAYVDEHCWKLSSYITNSVVYSVVSGFQMLFHTSQVRSSVLFLQNAAGNCLTAC